MMKKKLSKKERGEAVTKGYLEDQNYVTKDFLKSQNYVTKDFLKSQNYVTERYLDQKLEKYVTKDWASEMFEIYDKRAQDRMETLMEDNRDAIKSIVEAFESRFERIERKLEII